MKTQISRDGFSPDKRYSGVYQQQGRMITDRDWNELVDILKSRLDEGMADTVGSGLPRRRGVQITKGTGGPAIQPGIVYAGGVGARVEPAFEGALLPFRFEQQADFPSPPAPPVNRPYVLYADLWERPVTALEDPELRDPALNGADTTTRTRTMAQIKWAQTPWNPEDPAQNPVRGNSMLNVSVPERSAGDPGGTVDPAGGDFLLRVEVHEVRWQGNDPTQPTDLVIKWSRENGAEQYRATEAPSSFKVGSWAYEVASPESELHLGYHAPVSWQPTRGQLAVGFPTLSPETAAGSLIRRWDGFCAVFRNGNTWGFSSSPNLSPSRTAPGATVTLDGSRLTIRLIDLEISLYLLKKVFLAGDYWQVPVRRAVHRPGDTIADAVLPVGITHRYVTLANVAANGDVTPVAPTFSALSELTAADIRYSGVGCTNGLYDATTDNVKKALDRLWTLGAENAAYAKPANTSLYKDKTVANVRDALNLLADVRARQIVYDGRTGIPEVQTALDELFARPNGDSGGFTVGSGGEYPTLMAALQALLTGNRRDVRLFLLPGDHPLDTTAPVTNPSASVHLSLIGAGAASRLLVRKRTDFNDFASLTFQRLAIVFDPDTLFTVKNGELNFLDNRISGGSFSGLVRPDNCSRLLVRDNVVTVEASGTVIGPTRPSGPGVFLQIATPNIPTRLENNQISGLVALYGSPGVELSSTDMTNIALRLIGSVGFDIAATAELIATGNRMSGFAVGSAMIDTLRTKSPIAPLFQRILLSDNTLDGTLNQIAANLVELSGNQITSTPFGWMVGEEVLCVGNVARTDVAVDVMTRSTGLVQAGNSTHVKIRQVPPPTPR
jgi:hypothetical protein